MFEGVRILISWRFNRSKYNLPVQEQTLFKKSLGHHHPSSNVFGPTKFTQNAFSRDIRMSRDSVTVPETNSLHLKMDDWRTTFFLRYIHPIFRGKLLVSGRGITVNVHPLPSSLDHNDYKYKVGPY